MIENIESITAKLCSFARANHSICEQHSQKIFDDFLAFKLMGRADYLNAKEIIKKNFYFQNPIKFINEYICPIVLPRIAYAESRLCEFANRHKQIQYVILGAGMDTFSLRNQNMNINIFELDYPSTQKYKLGKIKTSGLKISKNVTFVPVDFEHENIRDVLKKHDFNFSLPTFFSFLGVAYYLDFNSLKNSIKSISVLQNKSIEIVFDFPDKTIRQNRKTKLLAEMTATVGEPMTDGHDYTEVKNLLENYNFVINNHLIPKEIQDIYLKNNKKLKAYDNIHFISATKENTL